MNNHWLERKAQREHQFQRINNELSLIYADMLYRLGKLQVENPVELFRYYLDYVEYRNGRLDKA